MEGIKLQNAKQLQVTLLSPLYLLTRVCLVSQMYNRAALLLQLSQTLNHYGGTGHVTYTHFNELLELCVLFGEQNSFAVTSRPSTIALVHAWNNTAFVLGTVMNSGGIVGNNLTFYNCALQHLCGSSK